MSDGKHNREHKGDGHRKLDPKKLADPTKGGGRHSGGSGNGNDQGRKK